MASPEHKSHDQIHKHTIQVVRLNMSPTIYGTNSRKPMHACTTTEGEKPIETEWKKGRKKN